MSDPISNAQLELACRLGAIDDLVEALDDGADINCKGGSPLFLAIMAGERAVVELLIERGADPTLFLFDTPFSSDAPVAEQVNVLMACGPGGAAGSSSDDGEGAAAANEPEIDPKLIGALDRMIRRKGLGEPFLKKRGDDYPAFRKALGGIGAEDCHAVVSEFLDALEEVRAQAKSKEEADANAAAETESEAQTAAADDQIFLAIEAERINEWSTRYAGTDEAPAELAREYLKERKKLEAAC